MSMPLSHFVPAYPSPSPCPQVHSLRVRLYSCPALRFFRTIFFFKLDFILLLLLLLFSTQQTGVSLCHISAQNPLRNANCSQSKNYLIISDWIWSPFHYFSELISNFSSPYSRLLFLEYCRNTHIFMEVYLAGRLLPQIFAWLTPSPASHLCSNGISKWCLFWLYNLVSLLPSPTPFFWSSILCCTFFFFFHFLLYSFSFHFLSLLPFPS